MHGRLACGRPLVVRLANEKYLDESRESSSKGTSEASQTSTAGGSLTPMSRSVKIAAIKNKLKALEEEGSSTKKKKTDDESCSDNLDCPIVKR